MDKCSRFFFRSLRVFCYVFTATAFIHLILLNGEMTRPLLCSYMLSSAACGLLQTLCFSCLVIKKLPHGLRVLLFAVTMFAVLSAIAMCFAWFPAGQMSGWIWLAAEFLVSLLITYLVSELWFRRKGAAYKKRLETYRADKNKS